MNCIPTNRQKLFSWFLIPLVLAAFSVARGEKIWTNVVSGFWQDGTNWTGHTPPDITSFIRITNDNTKTVTINALTPSSSLTVQVLTLSAPPGATNTLLVTDAGTNNPLTFQTGLELQDGAALRVTNSALLLQLTNDHMNIDGSMTLDSGFINFGDTTVTARVGRATSGVLTIHGGSASAGTMTIGGLTNSTGTVNMNGGQLLVSSLMSVGRNASTVGTVSLGGGQLSVPNDDTRVGDEGTGIMVVSNATATLANLQVGRDPTAGGTLAVQQDGLIQVQSDIVIARFTGATGLVTVAGGHLLAGASSIYAGRGGAGQLFVSNGLVQASRLLVVADTTNSIGGSGLLSVSGGLVLVNSNLSVGSVSYSTGQVAISGGTVIVTNAQTSGITALSSGTFELAGGALLTDSLELTNAAGQFSFSGGTLDSKSTVVANGSPFIVGNGTTAAILHLSGGTHSFANGLVISSNATLEGCGTIIGSIINHGTISTNCGGGTIVPPSIVMQPAGQSLTQGAVLSLSVSASGSQPLVYQWFIGPAVISGATSSSYVKANVQPGDAGNYTVVITNSAGAVTSAVAVVSVLIPPFTTTQPQNITTIAGNILNLSVVGGGTQPLSYQWQLGGTNLAGATTSAFTKTNVQVADAGNYSVAITNSAGSITSLIASVSVLVPPSITVPPQNATTTIGGSATFSVSATGSQPLAYQWQFAGTNIAGATTSVYTRTNVQTKDVGIYTVVVTNLAGSASSSATLQVSDGVTVSFVSRSGLTNTLSVESAAGTTYMLEFKDSLSQTNWTQTLPGASGTGGLLLLRDPSAPGTARFYRVLSF